MLIEHKWTTKGIMTFDVAAYYGYLPQFVNGKSSEWCAEEYQFPDLNTRNKYVKASNGNKVLKTTMGMSILYLPFHTVAMFYHRAINGWRGWGFELPYRVCMSFVGVFYLLLGLLFCRASLLKYFGDDVTAASMLLVVLGTNMYYYTTTEGCMTHVPTFALFSVFIWLTIKWHEQPSWRWTFALGLLSGLLALVRPTNVIIGVVFLLYGVSNFEEGKLRLRTFIRYKYHFAAMFLLAVAVWIPQMLYWKSLTGGFFFYPYLNEHFFFDKPKIWYGMLGWRKGWLLYTPMGWVMLAGLFVLGRYARNMAFAVFIFVPVFIYVVFSWWCWWYGGSYSIRVMVDAYAVLMFPLASTLTYTCTNRIATWLKLSFTAIVVFLTAYSIFQTYQYKQGIIHYDSMTRQAFMHTLFSTQLPPENLLKEPPWGEATLGEYAE